MFALNLLTLAFAAAATVALPAAKRDLAPSCNLLGGGAFDTATNFTLAAWNTTLPNANNTGVPLVLGQAGAISGAEFKVFSTFASFPFNQYPSLSLDKGRLIPHGTDVAPAKAGTVPDGSEPGFIVSNDSDPEQGAQIYCGVADIDPAGHGTGHPFLAVNGDTDSFALCKAGTQNNIVFKPAAGKGYDLSSCYAVKVQIIEEF
ncbi:hypothetical protein OH76DRAFT_1412848 [Lentinus brumalis]|uniref:Uncharacterized protein n=1 Tax=Lentinus brumalis TaxID=2498619 RepID=A0A371CK16_9APHY|nr:hypothetical protein OH76DRAFT_1412848 [Polyporus brumalis]